jgi:hypothetical protein
VPRVLLLATTTGYQTRAFEDAARRLDVELVYATDRCHVLDDPWRDRAVPIRFHDADASLAAVLDAARTRPIDGVLAVGDRPAAIAGDVARALGLPGHPPAAAAAAGNKLMTRSRLKERGLPVPWFEQVAMGSRPEEVAGRLRYPCVLKPLALSGSRGVMRVDDPEGFAAAFLRLRALLATPAVRAERNPAHDWALVEGFIPGPEFAVEGLLHRGTLHVLAVFDKPDRLDGPFFEETIYVTPSRAAGSETAAIAAAVAAAAAALGLHHGPVHAECRLNAEGVFVLEVAARPIGGLCARALRFVGSQRTDAKGIGNPRAGGWISLEELLLRHALGDSPAGWQRERAASGVMMIPIPRRGVFRGVRGVDAARAVPGVDDVQITAKPDQLLVPLPEGASYPGFIFACAEDPAVVERALREAHRCLGFLVDPELPIARPAVQS